MANDFINIEFDRIVVSPRAFEFKRFIPSLESVMVDIMADHSRKYAAGLAPDGTAQKAYSAAYAAKKAGGRVSSRKGLAGNSDLAGTSTPNLKVTGKLLDSRQVSSTDTEVRAVFEGSHYSIFGTASALASSLRGRGFKLHSFSEENIKMVKNRLAAEIPGALTDAITIERKN